MTIQEKKEMYQGKKQFIENVNEVFQIEPGCSSVVGVTYEVYFKDFGNDHHEFREWIIVHYVGGGKCPKIVSGNSNAANFRAIGSLLDGGYYDSVRMYEDQIENGFERVEL